MKPALIRRLHDAMLTLFVHRPSGPAQRTTGRIPSHLVEFADRVGEEIQEAERERFRPNAAQVSDMLGGLELLEGLTKPLFRVAMFRAINEFAKDHNETPPWPWSRIGEYFGLSDRWAETAYDTAIVQAARRAGLLPTVSKEYGVLAVAVWQDRGWLTNLGTAADPRQAVSNLKTKSPVAIAQAFVVWVPGKHSAQRVIEAIKPELRGRLSHGSWYKVHPDVMANDLVEHARTLGIDWIIEEIAVKGPQAA